jgi:hypothetical protein
MSNIPPSFQQQAYGQTGSFSQPPRSSGGMSIWTILGITAAVVMLMVILLCSGLIFLGMRVAVDSKQLRVARDSIGVSEIQVPENWQDIRGAQRNEDASLQLGNRFAETYAMIITEPKSDFDEASTKFPTAEGSFSVKDYSELIVEHMITNSTGLVATNNSTVTVGNRPAIRVNLKGNVSGIPLAYVLTFVDGNKHFHQVHAWTLANRETTNMPTLLKVVDSFRETNAHE